MCIVHREGDSLERACPGKIVARRFFRPDRCSFPSSILPSLWTSLPRSSSPPPPRWQDDCSDLRTRCGDDSSVHTFDLRAGLVDIVNSLTTALDFGSSNEHSRFTRFAPDIVQSIELWLCQPRTKAGYVCVRQGRPPACSAHCHRDHVHVYTPTPGTFVIFVGGERFVQSPKTKTCRCSSAWLQHNVLRNIYHNEHSSKDER